MIFWSNKSFLKADDLLLLFLPKKFFSILGVAHNVMTSFQCKLGPKKTIVKRFYQLFFRTTGLQHKLLILYPLNIFDWKSAKKSKAGVVFGAKIGPN